MRRKTSREFSQRRIPIARRVSTLKGSWACRCCAIQAQSWNVKSSRSTSPAITRSLSDEWNTQTFWKRQRLCCISVGNIKNYIDKSLRPSPGASRHPLPMGEGQYSGRFPLPLGEGGAKRRVRVEGLKPFVSESTD